MRRRHFDSLSSGKLENSRACGPASFANFIAFKLLGECGILTNEEFDITENYDATALLGLLASKKVSSITVTTAFCKRAAIDQQLVSEPFLLPMNAGN